MLIFLFRVSIFIKSLLFHISLGLPKASKKEIKLRYNICLSCDKFNKDKSRCEVCGCNVEIKSRFFNKLAWADQECPLSKWSKIIR